jgi:hypothetical protein
MDPLVHDFRPLEKHYGAVRLIPTSPLDSMPHDSPIELLPRCDALAVVAPSGNRREVRVLLGGALQDSTPAVVAESQARARAADVDAAVDAEHQQTPEYAAKEAAAEELNQARAELAAARRKHTEAKEAFETALAEFKNPAPLRPAIDASETAAADLAKWVERLTTKFAAVSLVSGQVRARIWGEHAALQRQELVSRHAALKSRVADVVAEVGAELLALSAMQSSFGK